MNMIAIVDHTSEAQQAVNELIVGIQRDEFGFDVRAEDQPDLFDVPAFYQHGGGGFWLAKRDAEIVGSIALRDIGNGSGALRKMFVKPAYRGREHGVAARLLEHLLAAAARGGLATIYLGTTERFLAAHRFYEKNGFVLISPDTLPEAFPRMAVDTRFYRRGP